MVKYLVLLGLSLGLIACEPPPPIKPLSGDTARAATIILDKNNPCIVHVMSERDPYFGFVAQIIGCDPNEDQRLPE